ncbi:MAG: hypothetical protein HRT47_05925 [Candidatus Caenarcaniphilales bacterium]|nr:hypothetical protein [Candidatus Caenarcaniphilales bacterium]
MFQKNHILLVFLLFASISLSAKARFVDTTCVSGNCGINLDINNDDLIINFTNERPLIRLQLNANNVNVDANFSKTFKILAYEQIAGGNNVLSVSNVLFPRKRFKNNKLVTRVKLRPFVGSKQIFLGLHNSSGALLSTYRVSVSGSGSVAVANNLNKNPAIDFSCPDLSIDQCNRESLFFNKVVFETNTDQNARETYVLKNNDGTYTVEIPLISSLGRRRIKNVVRNSNSAGFPTPTNTPQNVINTLNASAVIMPDGSEQATLNFDQVNSKFALGFDNLNNVFTIDNEGNIGVGTNSPRASLEIATTDGSVAPFKIGSGVLNNNLLNGSFEFDGNELYFTLNGQRYFVVRDPNSSSPSGTGPVTPPNFVSSVTETDRLGGQLPSFYQNASNIDAGTLNPARLPANLGAFELRNVLNNRFLTLDGGHDIIMRSQADTTLTLPDHDGTLATLDDLNLSSILVTTADVINNDIQTIDIADNSVTEVDINDLNASQFISGTFSNSVLPNRDIANITNLSTELDNRISKSTEIVDDLTSTDTDKVLSANQGRVLKDLIDNFSTDFSTSFSALPGTELSFADFNTVYTKTLTANENFTAINFNQGHKVILLMSGNFTPSFPSSFVFIKGAYDPTKNNVMEFEVASDINGSEKVLVSVISQTITP